MIPTLPVAVVMWYHRLLSKESLSPCLQSYREGRIWGFCSCLDFCCRGTSSMELGVLLSPPLRRASQGQEKKDTKLCSCWDLDCWNTSMHRASNLSPSASSKLSPEVGRKDPKFHVYWTSADEIQAGTKLKIPLCLPLRRWMQGEKEALSLLGFGQLRHALSLTLEVCMLHFVMVKSALYFFLKPS